MKRHLDITTTTPTPTPSTITTPNNKLLQFELSLELLIKYLQVDIDLLVTLKPQAISYKSELVNLLRSFSDWSTPQQKQQCSPPARTIADTLDLSSTGKPRGYHVLCCISGTVFEYFKASSPVFGWQRTTKER